MVLKFKSDHNLTGNNLNDHIVNTISEVLKINTTLTEIFLGSNCITDESAKAISEVLKLNTSLTKLDLSKNLILSNGIKHIADSLLSNLTLTELILSINIIDSHHFIDPINDFIKTTANLNLASNKEDKTELNIENVICSHYEKYSELNASYKKSNDLNNADFLKAYITIVKICNRNRQKELLLVRATPIFQVLAPGTPLEIADLIARELLITESSAETLRRVGDLI